ncbi:MAG: flavin-containing monooxygenase [Pseudomonadales bacterium]
MSEPQRYPSVLIIGAGMTGLCVAIKLRLAGITDIVIVEKGDRVGGTWRENTYPGVACDVPSHAYTYSFAPNPEWSDFIAPGKEIQRYFQKVFTDFSLEECTHFNETIVSATFLDEKWYVESDLGNSWPVDILFAATGMLHHPFVPRYDGQDSFAGKQFHSARWDHSVDLQGKRIAVVGTGSSATQLIPKLIALSKAHVSVFQRTAQWIVKLEGSAYTEQQKAKFRQSPKKMRTLKKSILWAYDKATTALTSQSRFHKILRRLMAWNARRFLHSSVKNPALLAKLTPDYQIGCKRVVMNAEFYDAIQRDNAELVTEAIDSIETDGIRTKDKRLHEVDVIVYATGFDPVAYMRPIQFKGLDGIDINAVWRDKVQAYRSVCLPGFPNFFLMLGPNSPIGNYSVIAISEAQTDYALQLIELWRNNTLSRIEATADAQARWNAGLKAKLGQSVWSSGGCNSWYLDKDGDPITWPGSWQQFLASIAEPDLRDFVGLNAGNFRSNH